MLKVFVFCFLTSFIFSAEGLFQAAKVTEKPSGGAVLSTQKNFTVTVVTYIAEYPAGQDVSRVYAPMLKQKTGATQALTGRSPCNVAPCSLPPWPPP